MQSSIPFPPPPPTSNTRSSRERSALLRSSRKLSRVLGDVPRVLEDDVPAVPSTLELTRTITATSICGDTESAWRKRKPTHLPPLLKLSNPSVGALDSPASATTPVYHRPPPNRGSVLSIVSNAPSTASGSSAPEAPSDSSNRRAKLERLRRKLGDEVPATAVFPTTPRTAVPRTSTPSTSTSSRRGIPRSRSRSIARLPNRAADDARPVVFSISSDESVHTVTLTATRLHSPRPRKTRHAYHAGALPPVPPIPAYLASNAASRHTTDDDDAGLIRPRQKMAAGSKIGGSDFKAARRAKREGRGVNGMGELGEMIEMVGFLF